MHSEVMAEQTQHDDSQSDSTTARLRGHWLRLLNQVLDLAGPQAEFLHHAERPWVSATFSGDRHTIALAFTGPVAMAQGEAFANALPDHEFTIPGHLVADAAVACIERVGAPPTRMTMDVELLLLNDI